MKRIFFLFALLLMSTFLFANNQSFNQSFNQNFKAEIVVNEISQSEQIKTKLTFYSLNDFRCFDVNQLHSNLEGCTVEIEVSCTVTIGIASATIKLKASGIPCDQVKEKVRSMIAEAKAAAIAALK
ncbi:MAG: hypothetical protein MH132_00310 [Hydrotalea sp.]|nr:hypothetical protein [Hydrotalea sp.]